VLGPFPATMLGQFLLGTNALLMPPTRATTANSPAALHSARFIKFSFASSGWPHHTVCSIVPPSQCL
jgi:hypothetical protein